MTCSCFWRNYITQYSWGEKRYKYLKKKDLTGRVLMAQTCNPSYSRRLWLKAAQANSSPDPILKNPSYKRAGGVAQGVGPEFKPQHREKK
jgi:hypothetical protein